MHDEDDAHREDVAVEFSLEQARTIGETIGIDWSTVRFDVHQFRRGLLVELEHGRAHPETDVTGSDPILTGKIALAHLNEIPDYYDRLEQMELDASSFWSHRELL